MYVLVYTLSVTCIQRQPCCNVSGNNAAMMSYILTRQHNGCGACIKTAYNFTSFSFVLCGEVRAASCFAFHINLIRLSRHLTCSDLKVSVSNTVNQTSLFTAKPTLNRERKEDEWYNQYEKLRVEFWQCLWAINRRVCSVQRHWFVAAMAARGVIGTFVTDAAAHFKRAFLCTDLISAHFELVILVAVCLPIINPA